MLFCWLSNDWKRSHVVRAEKDGEYKREQFSGFKLLVCLSKVCRQIFSTGLTQLLFPSKCVLPHVKVNK